MLAEKMGEKYLNIINEKKAIATVDLSQGTPFISLSSVVKLWELKEIVAVVEEAIAKQ